MSIQGNRAFADGDFSTALIHYSKAIKLNPKDHVFFSNRALVYLKLSRFYESMKDFANGLTASKIRTFKLFFQPS